MDLVQTITQLGGIATRDQLAVRGFSGFELTAAIRMGQIRRVRRAHYSVRSADPDAIQAVRIGGRLAGVSAARSYGLWSGFDPRLHVGLPANASRLRTNLAPSVSERITPDTTTRDSILHWLSPSPHDSCWRVSADDCLRQVASWADAETAIACLDTARTMLGYTDEKLAALFRPLPAVPRVRAAASRPGSDSGPESVVRQRLLRSGIVVAQQVAIPVVGRVDMVVTGTCVVIEVDGRSYHSSPDSFENDRRRDALLAALGYTVVRLSFAQVFGNWVWCERMIVAAITQFRKE